VLRAALPLSWDEIQRAVFQHPEVRRAPGVFAFHPANRGYRRPTEAAILQGLGVRRGVPDVIAIQDGRVYGLELKPAGGRLSPAQREAHAAMRAAAASVAVAVGLDNALRQLQQWKLLRGRMQSRRYVRQSRGRSRDERPFPQVVGGCGRRAFNADRRPSRAAAPVIASAIFPSSPAASKVLLARH
jgi:hypothetical protein